MLEVGWLRLLFIFCLWEELPVISGKHIPNFAGPYYIVIRRGFSNETDEFTGNGDLWAKGRVSHYRLRELQYFWGRMYSRIPVSDDLKVRVYISKWNNNQWQRNHFVMRFSKGCHDLLEYASSIAAMLFGKEAKCPIPSGDRLIRNHTHDIVFPHVPVFPYGRWLFTVVINLRSQIEGVFVMEVETRPKLN